jgi:pimeloyl-ACP methyl ester carboxylesterase
MIGCVATMHSETLHVPGARLYYEVRGSGPVLLMMPGGPADGGIFHVIAEDLAADHTVVTYDPRGLSHSTLEGPVDNQRLVEIMADDVHRLIEAVGEDKAFVFASSGGAVISLDLAVRYPEQILALVAHEPPRFAPAPEGGTDLHEVYRTRGVRAAIVSFIVGAGLGEPPAEALDSMEKSPDFDFFFGHYVVGLGKYEPDVAALKQAPCRIIPAVGGDSAGQFAHLGGLGLAKILGMEAAVFPGGHGGFMSHPAEFAKRLREVLDQEPSM